MKWVIYFYILPGLITTWLLPKFVEYNGGQNALKLMLEEYKEEYYGYLIGFMSFIPILNIISSLTLIWWYVCQIFNKSN